MDEIKNRIEAILFTTGRLMDIQELSNICGIASQGVIRDAIKELKKEYEERNNSLQIVEEDNQFMLNIKKKYNYLTTKLLTDTELDMPMQETLAIIAYKQPMLQCDLIKIRGNSAYEHVKILKEQSFISSEKSGRTRLLKLTSKFFDYFDVIEAEKLKSKFQKIEDKVLPPDLKVQVQSKLIDNNNDQKLPEKSKLDDKLSEKNEESSKNDKTDEEVKVDNKSKPLGSISFED